MKKIIFALILIVIAPKLCFSGSTEFKTSDAEILKAYESGIKTAKEAEKNRQLWSEGKGNPEMAKQYQEGLSFAKKAMEEHKRLYRQAENNISQQDN